MADAKIEIKVGAVSFVGEGDGKWLSDQLDKVLEKLPLLANINPAEPDAGGNGGAPAPNKTKLSGTLAGFLKEKNASKQVRKFLATAIWLQDRDKHEHLTTKDISKALSDAKQSQLTNASQSLAQNVGKGFCQKQGKSHFFVTDEGRSDIG